MRIVRGSMRIVRGDTARSWYIEGSGVDVWRGPYSTRRAARAALRMVRSVGALARDRDAAWLAGGGAP